MSVDSVPQHFKVVRDRNREFSPQLSNKGTVRLQEHLQTAFQRTTNIEKIVDGGRKSVDSDKFPLQLLLRRDIHRKIFVSMRLCFIAIFKHDEIPKNTIKVLRLLWAPLRGLWRLTSSVLSWVVSDGAG